jgi:hypothetical protein
MSSRPFDETPAMTVTHALHRLGGVASREVLIRATSRKEFRRSVAADEIVRDAHGRYALPVADEAVRAANRLSGAVSHRTAALRWGWQVKTVPDRPDVTIRRKRHLAKHQADGVELHWADLKPDDVTGIVTSKERTLVDCMRSLPFDEALAIADSALRCRDITKVRLVELADALSRVPVPGRLAASLGRRLTWLPTRSSRCCAPSASRSMTCTSSPRWSLPITRAVVAPTSSTVSVGLWSRRSRTRSTADAGTYGATAAVTRSWCCSVGVCSGSPGRT